MKRADIIQAIEKHHLEEAIKYIDDHGVPPRRNSTKYSFRDGGHLYPPKYMVAIAYHCATGKTLSTQDHSGGEQDSNKILVHFGFKDIVRQPSDQPKS